MIGDHPLAENLPEPIDQLGRESDLRHEQQHLSAPGQHLGSEVHINFRFARTGDTPQQARSRDRQTRHGSPRQPSARAESVGRRNCAPPVTGPGATSRSIQVNNPFFTRRARAVRSAASRLRATSAPSGARAANSSSASRCRGARRPIRSSAAASPSAVSASPARATSHSRRGRNSSAANSSSPCPLGFISDGAPRASPRPACTCNNRRPTPRNGAAARRAEAYRRARGRRS